ncbi:hypothetical protein ACU8WE_30445 [Pseudomonas parakoreensis]
MSFRDAQQGWAVGAYGILVHTRDGGKSWGSRLDPGKPRAFALQCGPRSARRQSSGRRRRRASVPL